MSPRNKSLFWMTIVGVIIVALILFAATAIRKDNLRKQSQKELTEHLPLIELAGQKYYWAVQDYLNLIAKDVDLSGSDSAQGDRSIIVARHENELWQVFMNQALPKQMFLPLVYELPLRSPDYFPPIIHEELRPYSVVSNLQKAWEYWQPAKQKFDSLYKAAGHLDE